MRVGFQAGAVQRRLELRLSPRFHLRQGWGISYRRRRSGLGWQPLWRDRGRWHLPPRSRFRNYAVTLLLIARTAIEKDSSYAPPQIARNPGGGPLGGLIMDALGNLYGT